jgi:drug/metabolite transporter (DMT)-like permease
MMRLIGRDLLGSLQRVVVFMTMVGGRSWKPLLGLAVLSLIWGYNWVVMKQALRFSGPFTFAALRSLLGGLALALVLVLLRRSLAPGSLLAVITLGILQTATFTGLATWALVSGGAGKTAVLVYTMPLWLLLMAWPILGEKLRGIQWLAVVLAFGGLFFILQPWALHRDLFSTGLALLAGFCWALSGVWIKLLRRRFKLDLLPFTAWQLFIGGIPLMILAVWLEPQPVEWVPYFWGALAYNAVPATAIAWLLWLYALQELPAGVAGMSTLFTPLVGVAAAWLQLGGRPGYWDGAGMMLILCGLAVLTWHRLKTEAT